MCSLAHTTNWKKIDPKSNKFLGIYIAKDTTSLAWKAQWLFDSHGKLWASNLYQMEAGCESHAGTVEIDQGDYSREQSQGLQNTVE